MYLNSIYYSAILHRGVLFPNCLFSPLLNQEYSIYEFNPTTGQYVDYFTDTEDLRPGAISFLLIKV